MATAMTRPQVSPAALAAEMPEVTELRQRIHQSNEHGVKISCIAIGANHSTEFSALMAGIAGGAEAILIPEIETEPAQVVQIFRSAYERGKTHACAVVASSASTPEISLTIGLPK